MGVKGRFPVLEKDSWAEQCSFGRIIVLGSEAAWGPSRRKKMDLGSQIQALAWSPETEPSFRWNQL